MRRTTAVLIVAVVAFSLFEFFLLAPVFFWFTETGGPVGYESGTPVYRSLGCATLGFGDLYAPGWFGFSFGCEIPVPIPL